MNMQVKRTKITTWVMEIHELKEKGVVICRLMNTHPMQFTPEATVCDIPKTRQAFLQSHPHAECCYLDHCRPREIYTDEASRELECLPHAQLKRPRGSWTATLKKKNPAFS